MGNSTKTVRQSYRGLHMTRFYSKQIRKAKGFTLIEVLVAITILLLVVLPLASLYVKSLGVIQNAALYSQAIQLAQERMEVCQTVQYPALYYYNEIMAPGFPFAESPLPAGYGFDGQGNAMVEVVVNAYDNRDNPDTDRIELEFDPTDWNTENYPVPVYRDYYNNYTGRLLDPNFNGLCDDDLDGDGIEGILGIDTAFGAVDMDDIEIATNGRLFKYTDLPTPYDSSPAASLDTWMPGDGLWDTVVEGKYVANMDPMYRKVRVTESVSPIIDYALLFDREHDSAVADFRHREQTYKNFVRMTTFIDPTPSLGTPLDTDSWMDDYFFNYDATTNQGYSGADVFKTILCLQRDLPLNTGLTNSDLGVLDSDLIVNDDRQPDAFTLNYSPPIYGMRIIVTVFYLTGEGEIELVDFDGDGVYEEQPVETYGGARRVRLEREFYNNALIAGSGKIFPPPRQFFPDTNGGVDNPLRSVTITDTGSGDDFDQCSYDNNGLTYLVTP